MQVLLLLDGQDQAVIVPLQLGGVVQGGPAQAALHQGAARQGQVPGHHVRVVLQELPEVAADAHLLPGAEACPAGVLELLDGDRGIILGIELLGRRRQMAAAKRQPGKKRQQQDEDAAQFFRAPAQVGTQTHESCIPADFFIRTSRLIMPPPGRHGPAPGHPPTCCLTGRTHWAGARCGSRSSTRPPAGPAAGKTPPPYPRRSPGAWPRGRKRPG